MQTNGTFVNPVYLVYCDVIRRAKTITVESKHDNSLNDECETAFNSLKDSGSATMIFPWELSSIGTYWCALWTAKEYVNLRIVITVEELLGISIAQLHNQILSLILYVH